MNPWKMNDDFLLGFLLGMLAGILYFTPLKKMTREIDPGAVF